MAQESPAPAQRRWRAACPNCGAPVEFASSSSSYAICSFCRSTLLRQDDVLLRTGESAELFADYSPLQIGTQGKLQGEPFTVLGRVQIAYEGGRWNEWHAFFDNSGKSAWLSEDNGRFVASWPLPLAAAPARSELALGAQQVIEGQSWRVAALTPATLHAAEGELPQPPKLGQPVFVAELRSSRDEVGSLEYVDGAAPRWSVGRAVQLDALGLSNLREESASSWAGRSLECPNCGAAIQPQLSQSLSVACGQCQSVVDLSGGAGKALKHHEQAIGIEPPIPLGRTGKLSVDKGGDKLPWQVVGFLERASRGDDEQYFWREYLLFNKQQGFAFLVDSSEGWSLVRVLTGAPEPVGAGVRWQGQQFNLKERYEAVTTHVLGEFYWQVKKNEVGEVADFERSDLLLSCEKSANEITWSLGRKLDANEVALAFNLSATQRARMQPDVGPFTAAQTGVTLKGVVIFFFVMILLVTMIKSCSDDDCDKTRTTFGAQSLEHQQCLANQRSGAYYRGSGSSGGGFGGGGHK